MGITMEKQRAILESVIKEEIDFISYVDLEDGMVHTIVTNEDADVMPPIDGDYQKVNSRVCTSGRQRNVREGV